MIGIGQSVKVEFYGITRTNHIPNFNSGLWTFHGNVTVDSNKKITLNADGYTQASTIVVNVKPNEYYLLNVIENGNSYFRYVYEDDTTSSAMFIDGYVKTTTPSNCKAIKFYLQNGSSVGTFTFEEPLLYKIDQSTYDKIGGSWSDKQVEMEFPYVESEYIPN